MTTVSLKNGVFNTSIGSPYTFVNPILTQEQDRQILASLFEQLLIFDKITLSTNRLNFTLEFLISRLGINTVERLFDNGYLKLLIWSPVIVSGTGRKQENGTIDESVIYGQPPIVAGSLGGNDIDPETNISNALIHFNFHRDRKRILTKRLLKFYEVPDGMEFSTGSAKLVIDSYQNNNLEGFGLPFQKEANQLDLDQRKLLLSLGHKVIETAILSKYNLKSYENFEHFEICKQNIANIGKAYNVSQNTTELFKLANLPNLKELYLSEKMNFDSIFTLRHLSTAKFYRKWINDVGEDFNAQEISAEFINQIKGNSKFFETFGGKFIKNLISFGISSALGAALAAVSFFFFSYRRRSQYDLRLVQISSSKNGSYPF